MVDIHAKSTCLPHHPACPRHCPLYHPAYCHAGRAFSLSPPFLIETNSPKARIMVATAITMPSTRPPTAIGKITGKACSIGASIKSPKLNSGKSPALSWSKYQMADIECCEPDKRKTDRVAGPRCHGRSDDIATENPGNQRGNQQMHADKRARRHERPRRQAPARWMGAAIQSYRALPYISAHASNLRAAR